MGWTKILHHPRSRSPTGRRYRSASLCILFPGQLFNTGVVVWGFLSLSIPVYSLAITFTPVFFWSLFVFNVIMTMATGGCSPFESYPTDLDVLPAGRIWWKGRAAQLVLGKQQIQRYHTAIAIMYVHCFFETGGFLNYGVGVFTASRAVQYILCLSCSML